MASIFISYRRADSASTCGRIYDRCVGRFGRHAIFKDVDSIPPGVDFRHYIADVMAKCVILLAVIGPHWLDITGASGARRLDEPDDAVRIEIEAALAQGLFVLPVLVDGAQLPPNDQLPPSIQALADLNAEQVGFDPAFEPGMRRILDLAEEQVAPGTPWQERRNDYDPLPDRQADLLAAVRRNIEAGKPPYAGVIVHSRGELGWILRDRGWSGEADAPFEQRADLRGAILRRASLTEMRLYGADLTAADLRGSDLRGVDLGASLLDAADLRGARLDANTTLGDAWITDRTKLADVVWNGARLTQIAWEGVFRLGDDVHIREATTRDEHARAYRDAGRAYGDLARELQRQGLEKVARRFRLRALQMERLALLTEHNYLGWLSNYLPYVVMGSGELPSRVLVFYVALVFCFALGFYSLGHVTELTMLTSHSGPPLSLAQALAVSISAATLRTPAWTPASGDVIAQSLLAAENLCALVVLLMFVGVWLRRLLRF